MNELSSRRTETGKTYELDPKLGRGRYALEAATGPVHYKETYRDQDPWLDLDEGYAEEGEIKGSGKVLVYPKLPNIVTVYQDKCGYEIRSRSNPGHLARVELVRIDGQEVTAWQDGPALKIFPRVHPRRVGIWKDFSGRERSTATKMRWKITELGSPGRLDSHPFAFRESPEAFSTARLDDLSPDGLDADRVSIETARTRIDDHSWYWDESIPAKARLVDTDFQIAAGADDGYYSQNSSFYPSANYLYFSVSWYRAWTRFTNVTLPKDTVLITGGVKFRSYGNYNNVRGAQYYWSDADNPTAPSSTTDAQARNRTWYANEQTTRTWTTGNWYDDIPDFKNAAQAYLNKDYWASGKAMLFFYDSWGGSVTFIASTYNHSPSYAPTMVLTYGEDPRGRSIFVPDVSWLSKSLIKRREI